MFTIECHPWTGAWCGRGKRFERWGWSGLSKTKKTDRGVWGFCFVTNTPKKKYNIPRLLGVFCFCFALSGPHFPWLSIHSILFSTLSFFLAPSLYLSFKAQSDTDCMRSVTSRKAQEHLRGWPQPRSRWKMSWRCRASPFPWLYRITTLPLQPEKRNWSSSAPLTKALLILRSCTSPGWAVELT